NTFTKRLTESIGESPNRFGKLGRARRKNRLKSLGKLAMGKAFWQIADNIRYGCREKVIKKTFGKSPNALSDLRLLAESYITNHQIKHKIKGEMGTLDEPPNGSTSSIQRAYFQPNFTNTTPENKNQKMHNSNSNKTYNTHCPGILKLLPVLPNLAN
ncbi:hypothetical protein H5410_016458, partial [Solanum commersonii]